MNINQINTLSNNGVTSSTPSNRQGRIFDGIVRGIRTVLTNPLTLAAGLALLFPMPVGATRTTLSGSSGNALGATQPTPKINATAPNSTIFTQDYDLPVDIEAVTAAAKNALATNSKVDVGWMLNSEICEAGLKHLLFNGNKESAASAITWRANVAGTVHLRTALTPAQTARALGITVRDALIEEHCVQSMYVDAFNLPEAEQRLEAREAVLAQVKEPSENGMQCLRIPGTVIEGRNIEGVTILQAHLEKCVPITAPATTPSAEHVRSKRDLAATDSVANITTANTAITNTSAPDAEVLQQLADSIINIRAEYCPESANIIHGNSTNTQRELTTLQAQIHALCPEAIIHTFSSLNANSPSPRLGQSQLIEHLATILASKTTDDVYVISPPPLSGVKQNTQALEQIIKTLEKNNVIVFSASKHGWVNNVGGVQYGGNTAEKVVLKSALHSAEEHLVIPHEDSLLPAILVVSGIAVVLTAAGMMLRTMRHPLLYQK